MTEAGPRRFHLGDVLSITTGVVVSPRSWAGVFDLVAWMLGPQGLNQGPAVVAECRQHLLEQNPDLAQVSRPLFVQWMTGRYESRQAEIEDWLRYQVDRFGEYRDVTPSTRPR